jgi:hypothetical protein
MAKNALFAFDGEMMCFVHVLLNALDMKDRGDDVVIIFEGSSTALISQLGKKENPFHGLYARAVDTGLVVGACKACSAKLGVLDDVTAAGIPLLDDMSGHPSMAAFQDRGYNIITF